MIMALVASAQGFAITYGLNNAQRRGLTFIEPGTEVYKGMIVELNLRLQNIPVNVCKEKRKPISGHLGRILPSN